MAQQLRGTHTAQSLLNIYFSMCGTQRLEVSPHVHKRGKRLLVSFFFSCASRRRPPPQPPVRRRAPLTHVLGIESVAEETSARRQEVNSWLARRAEQDVPRVSAQKAKIERGRAQRERSRGERSGADVSHCLGEKNSPFRKQAGCIFSFPSPRPLSGNKSCAIMGGGGVEGCCQGLCGEEDILLEFSN